MAVTLRTFAQEHGDSPIKYLFPGWISSNLNRFNILSTYLSYLSLLDICLWRAPNPRFFCAMAWQLQLQRKWCWVDTGGSVAFCSNRVPRSCCLFVPSPPAPHFSFSIWVLCLKVSSLLGVVLHSGKKKTRHEQPWLNMAISEVHLCLALDFSLSFNSSVFYFHTEIIFLENWIIHAIELKGLRYGFQFIA